MPTVQLSSASSFAKIRKGNSMLCVIICENDECLHMWCERKDASKEPAREPECDAALSMHVQPTAVHLVGSQPLISSVVTLITHRIIALVQFDIDQEK